mmetsp:Transcript_14354/g.62342  ORF Transcript_14354/g.62342 Transcript_14354/m.62342 type:complete len:152 (-) Transcript_14354:973-1428(-)
MVLYEIRMKVPSQSKLTELRRTFRTALGPSRRVHLFEISVYKSYGVHDRHVMGRLFLSYLDGRVYCCRLCKTHLARLDELISKSFHCRHGKAYLFNEVANVICGPLENRKMTTGMHAVADIYCARCLRIVGWKYVSCTLQLIFEYDSVSKI